MDYRKMYEMIQHVLEFGRLLQTLEKSSLILVMYCTSCYRRLGLGSLAI